MTSEADQQAFPSRGPLAAGEYAFLACTVLFWAAFVVLLGKDTSWDFRNYHWYGPYALFNNRLAIDVAVAHQAGWRLISVPGWRWPAWARRKAPMWCRSI